MDWTGRSRPALSRSEAGWELSAEVENFDSGVIGAAPLIVTLQNSRFRHPRQAIGA